MAFLSRPRLLDALPRCGKPVFLCVYLLVSYLPAWSQKPEVPPLEYQIKASLIFNFLQYVQWPEEVWHDPELHICIAGRNPFGVALAPLENEIVRGRKLAIEYLIGPALDDLKRCQVVFFGRDYSDLKPLLGELKTSSVLTIGEATEFLDNGGIISMQIERNKVVFDINREAALQGRLEISSKLLRIARRVEGGGGG